MDAQPTKFHKFDKTFDRRWLVQYAKNKTIIDAKITERGKKSSNKMPFKDFQKYKEIMTLMVTVGPEGTKGFSVQIHLL